MLALSEVGGGPLSLARAGVFSRTYHLLAGTERVAILTRGGFGGRRGRFESVEGRWSIRARGLLLTHFAVVDPEREEEIASFRETLIGRGWLVLNGGATYEWRPLDFWHIKRGFVRENGEPVITMRSKLPLLRRRARITLDLDRLTPREQMAVVAAACYQYVTQNRRSTA